MRTDANIIKMPCPGLVEYIESGVLDGPVLDAYLEKRSLHRTTKQKSMVRSDVTHYPLIREVIETSKEFWV